MEHGPELFDLAIHNRCKIIFIHQVTTNVLKNRDSVSMAPPVKKLGRPLDVNVLIVTKETDVISVLRDSWEMVARIVLNVSRVMTVNSALLGSREKNVNNVL